MLVLFIENITTINIPVLNKPLINPEYLKGLIIVPFIALSYIFHASFVLQEAGPFLKNKTKNISISRGVGVLLNIILNLILIPYYHDLNKAYLGAAIATLISYFVMSCIIYFWNKSVFDFKYNWDILFGIGFFMAVAWYMSTYDSVLLKGLLPCLYILYYQYINKHR